MTGVTKKRYNDKGNHIEYLEIPCNKYNLVIQMYNQ